MSDKSLIEQARESVRKLGEMSSKEFFQMMEEAGVIDKKGNVLIRKPVPPEEQEAVLRELEAIKRGEEPPAQSEEGPGANGQGTELTLRLPAELHWGIQAAADAAGCSPEDWMLRALAAAVAGPASTPGPAPRVPEAGAAAGGGAAEPVADR